MTTPLRVTPGQGIPFDINIYGNFAILVVDSSSQTPTGIVVPYSYIQNSSAEAGSKGIQFTNINTSGLSKLVVPEVWNTQSNILQSQVYLAISILSEEQVNSLIYDKEYWFYVPYSTALGVIAWDALGSGDRDFSAILNVLILVLKNYKVEWEMNIDTIISSKYTNFISENNKIKAPYFLHPPLPPIDERNVSAVNTCYEISKHENLDEIIVDTPNYCTLVHNPLYEKHLNLALPYLCEEEVRDVVIQGKIPPDAVYLFELDDNRKFGRFVNTLTGGLKLLDYYLGFPCSKLNLFNAYITGDAISACFHGTVTAQIDGIKKIDLFYSERVVYPTANAVTKLINGVIIDSFVITDHNSGALKFKGFGISTHFALARGSEVEILVDDDDNFLQRVQQFYDVVVSYYKKAVLVDNETYYTIADTHRSINIRRGGKFDVINSTFSMERGWVTDVVDSETDSKNIKSVVLSATCIYSAYNFKSYNYYYKSELQEFDRRRKYYLRGYKMPKLDEKESEDVKTNYNDLIYNETINKGPFKDFGVYNREGSVRKNGISNYFYLNGLNDVYRNAVRNVE